MPDTLSSLLAIAYILFTALHFLSSEDNAIFVLKNSAFLLITDADPRPYPAQVPCEDRWQDIAGAVCVFFKDKALCLDGFNAVWVGHVQSAWEASRIFFFPLA